MRCLRHPTALSLAVELSPPASRVLFALLWAAAMLLLGTSPACPQTPSGPVATAVHVDLDRPPSYLAGALATGHVTNDSDYRLTNVRLRVDASDAEGHALAPTYGWVDGDVPAHGRAWFRVVVPQKAVRLSVAITGFDLVSIQSP